MRFLRSPITLFTAFLLAAAATSPPLAALQAADVTAQPIFLNADQLRWQNAPPELPKGAEMTVLLGDPSKPGPFVVRFRTPGEYRIPPHYHSRAETLTVLSGTLYLGGGEQFDPARAHTLAVGAFHYLPAKVPHFAFSKAPVVVEVHGEGPFDVVYLNPKDDPRKGSGNQ